MTETSVAEVSISCLQLQSVHLHRPPLSLLHCSINQTPPFSRPHHPSSLVSRQHNVLPALSVSIRATPTTYVNQFGEVKTRERVVKIRFQQRLNLWLLFLLLHPGKAGRLLCLLPAVRHPAFRAHPSPSCALVPFPRASIPCPLSSRPGRRPSTHRRAAQGGVPPPAVELTREAPLYSSSSRPGRRASAHR